VQSFNADGTPAPQSEKSIARLQKHYAFARRICPGLPEAVSIIIRSEIPPAIGIASSAAVFSCLAEAYAGLVEKKAPLSRTDISIIARLGSGSAARSIYGGFVALKNSEGDNIRSAYAEQIAPESHWALHDIIIVPSTEEKKVGSTEGHAMAQTSPLFEHRIKEIPRRMQECIDAIQKKDFEKLQHVSEEDSLNMHRVMETQTPSLQYLSSETHRIIREIESLRKSDHLEVLYTMDAGPTVHLFCTTEAKSAIEEYAEAQKNCVIFKAKIGKGSQVL
jgi:diphosphomevalonate decarboxylase